MKNALIIRLSLLALVFGLTTALAQAQTAVYSEDATPAGSGYWSIETDRAHPDYSVVRFYAPNHEQLYEERLDGLCLDPSKGTAKCRRTARQLSSALVELQQARNNSLVATHLGISRRIQRAYAAR